MMYRSLLFILDCWISTDLLAALDELFLLEGISGLDPSLS